MKRRFALSLLTALALLWQGAVSAAMVPMFVPAEAAATMPPCHMQHDQAQKAPAKTVLVKACCAGVQCHCAAACGAVALPMAAPLQVLLLHSSPTTLAPVSGLTAATLTQPLRPPIVRPV